MKSTSFDITYVGGQFETGLVGFFYNLQTSGLVYVGLATGSENSPSVEAEVAPISLVEPVMTLSYSQEHAVPRVIGYIPVNFNDTREYGIVSDQIVESSSAEDVDSTDSIPTLEITLPIRMVPFIAAIFLGTFVNRNRF